MAESKKEKCIEGQSLPAKLYVTEASGSHKKALAEKDVLDPKDPNALAKLIEEANNDNS